MKRLQQEGLRLVKVKEEDPSLDRAQRIASDKAEDEDSINSAVDGATIKGERDKKD